MGGGGGLGGHEGNGALMHVQATDTSLGRPSECVRSNMAFRGGHSCLPPKSYAHLPRCRRLGLHHPQPVKSVLLEKRIVPRPKQKRGPAFPLFVTA